MLDAVDGAAGLAGLAPGLSLADARAAVPGLVTRPADPGAERAAVERLAGWAERYTPLVAVVGPPLHGAAGLWLDVTGCDHLLGGEGPLLADIRRRLSAAGLASRLALADTPLAALALAAHHPATGGAEGAMGGLLVRPGRPALREALSPLPVAALGVPPAAAAALHRLGLRRIGDLVALPRAPLARRFGRDLVDRLDGALGLVARPISPRRPPPAHRAAATLAEPILHEAALAAVVDRLAGTLARSLEQAGEGARRLRLTCLRVDGGHAETAVGCARPSRDPAHLARLLAERYAGIDAGFGIDAVVLAATRAEPLDARQEGLDRRALGASAAAGDAGVAALCDRLAARLGDGAVCRLEPRASHWPERAQAVVPVGPLAPGLPWRRDLARPLRLQPYPQPVTVVALLPDHPPHLVRWNGRARRVVRAEGPERLEPEWWRPDAAAGGRDYHRLLLEDGVRLWVYRDDPAVAGGGRWWVQGWLG